MNADVIDVKDVTFSRLNDYMGLWAMAPSVFENAVQLFLRTDLRAHVAATMAAGSPAAAARNPTPRMANKAAFEIIMAERMEAYSGVGGRHDPEPSAGRSPIAGEGVPGPSAALAAPEARAGAAASCLSAPSSGRAGFRANA